MALDCAREICRAETDVFFHCPCRDKRDLDPPKQAPVPKM
jgi:hypothetical protein